jgi:hypothetical protein
MHQLIGKPVGLIHPCDHAIKTSTNMPTDSMTRNAKARAMDLGFRGSLSCGRRNMKKPAPASAASTATKKATMIDFMGCIVASQFEAGR